MSEEKKKRNLYVEFQQHSQDFLLLLGEKARAAGRSKSAAEELSTLEFFWDGVDAIFKEYEKLLHTTMLRGATDHMLLAMANEELKRAYNELFKMASKYKESLVLEKVLKTSMIPTKKEMMELIEKDLIFKTPDDTYEKQQRIHKPSGGGSGQGNSQDSGQP